MGTIHRTNSSQSNIKRGVKNLSIVPIWIEYPSDKSQLVWRISRIEVSDFPHSIKVLLVQTVKDELKLIDPSLAKELEESNASAMEILYHTRFSRSESEPKYSFSGSFYLCRNSIYILVQALLVVWCWQGIKKMFRSYLLSWEERIEELVKSNSYQQALVLCRMFYEVVTTTSVNHFVGQTYYCTWTPKRWIKETNIVYENNWVTYTILWSHM